MAKKKVVKRKTVKKKTPASQQRLPAPPPAVGEAFGQMMAQAQFLAESDLIPEAYRDKPANVLVAMQMAKRLELDFFDVVQNLVIIHGKTTWSSSFLIRCINASGKYHSFDYQFYPAEKDAKGCRVVAATHDGEIINGPWVTMEMAKAEGWYNRKGSKWKTLPTMMLRYRAAAFFHRTHCPEIGLGLETADDAYDAGPGESAPAEALVSAIASRPTSVPPLVHYMEERDAEDAKKREAEKKPDEISDDPAPFAVAIDAATSAPEIMAVLANVDDAKLPSEVTADLVDLANVRLAEFDTAE